ncbi:DUF4239 domain-containing protein [Streptomyces sp. NBC_00091]|uniref:bestrophin-like domain n=1 Tax=Streptomyces sp. NBC_00091 TaxID=2975648 RepID=UPI002254F110|nr:DUF4239 domain-containing protein [Streptomyces sp. NBC_00091]MCX5377661.1 DUF4239 domain-containing protein [Streptomyces sp. NBC_00091]
MSLWLLNHFSTFTLSVLLVGAIMAAAVIGSLAARRAHPRLAEGEHNEMVGVVLGMFGAIYGIILAFVVVTLWTQLDHTQTVVSKEATDLALVVRSADVFPPADRERIQSAVGRYAHAVVDIQWPKMRAGEPSHAATADHVEGMYRALQAYEPTDARTQTFYEEAAASLNDAAGQRRERIDLATTELPTLLQVLVFGGALVLIPLTFIYGLRSLRMQLLFVASVAALIGFSLLLVLVLDRPFAGELSVDPSPFREGALVQFWQAGAQG